MQTNDWLQFALFLGVLALITKPIGLYLTQVLDPQGKTWLDPIIIPLEKLTYRLMGVVDPPVAGTPAEAATMLAADGRKWSEVVRRIQLGLD